MMVRNKAIFNWSGGKDSCMALYYMLQDPSFQITTLLTTLSDRYDRIAMHGVRRELLMAQGAALGLPVKQVRLPADSSMSAYNRIMHQALMEIRQDGITHSIFGDIFLEDLKKYREERLHEVGMTGHFPIWKRNTTELIREFIDLGFKTMLVCVKSDVLDKVFVGRVIDRDFIKDLPKAVDPCGENGEFHTFVFDGPIFKNPVSFEIGETVFKKYSPPKEKDDVCFTSGQQREIPGYYYLDLLPLDTDQLRNEFPNTGGESHSL